MLQPAWTRLPPLLLLVLPAVMVSGGETPPPLGPDAANTPCDTGGVAWISGYTGARGEPRGADVVPPPPAYGFTPPPGMPAIGPFFFFSDNPAVLDEAAARGWRPVKMRGKPVRSSFMSALKSKLVKAVPFEVHRELLNWGFRYVVYSDSKLRLDVPAVLAAICAELSPAKDDARPRAAMLVAAHPRPVPPGQTAQNIWDEFDASLQQPRYRHLGSQMDHYIRQKLRRQSGTKYRERGRLALTGFIVRAMEHPDTIPIGDNWMKEIEHVGIQCQIAFFFILQEYRSQIVVSTRPFVENKPALNAGAGATGAAEL